MRSRATLWQLLVVLALVLFGVPLSHADGTRAHSDSAAQSQVELAQGILSVQRQLLRAQLPHDDSPDFAGPIAANQTGQILMASAISPALHLPLLPVAIRILPPVRGPPGA